MASGPYLANITARNLGFSGFGWFASSSAVLQRLAATTRALTAGTEQGMTTQPVTDRGCPPASTSSPVAGDVCRPSIIKSAKRKAAEALLAARFAPSAVLAAHGSMPPEGLETSALKRLCSSKAASRSSSGAASPRSDLAAGPRLIAGCQSTCQCGDSTGWCHFQVKVPHINWSKVFNEPASSYTYTVNKSSSREAQRFDLPEGLSVYLVEHEVQAQHAINRLRESMQDSVIAIDLEWKPEYTAGVTNPVALMQLSSASVCVLLRISSMRFSLPAAVRAFLRDKTITVVGFSWDGSDESKMLNTFSIGKAAFHRFYDLQVVAHALGYHGYGLARLTKQVMGMDPPKNKMIARSNWAARSALSLQQIQYAAIDAFVTGQVFRALRLWHSSPSECPACKDLIGPFAAIQTFPCSLCNASFSSLSRYLSHCSNKQHVVEFGQCSDCGRVQRVSPRTPPPARSYDNEAAEEAGPSTGASSPSAVRGLLGSASAREDFKYEKLPSLLSGYADAAAQESVSDPAAPAARHPSPPAVESPPNASAQQRQAPQSFPQHASRVLPYARAPKVPPLIFEEAPAYGLSTSSSTNRLGYKGPEATSNVWSGSSSAPPQALVATGVTHGSGSLPKPAGGSSPSAAAAGGRNTAGAVSGSPAAVAPAPGVGSGSLWTKALSGVLQEGPAKLAAGTGRSQTTAPQPGPQGRRVDASTDSCSGSATGLSCSAGQPRPSKQQQQPLPPQQQQSVSEETGAAAEADAEVDDESLGGVQQEARKRARVLSRLAQLDTPPVPPVRKRPSTKPLGAGPDAKKP